MESQYPIMINNKVVNNICTLGLPDIARQELKRRYALHHALSYLLTLKFTLY